MTVSRSDTPGPVWVLGAGSIGCFVGGCLRAAGAEVHFIGRPRVLSGLAADGLRVSDLDGRDETLPSTALHLHEAPPTGAAPSLVLLCVKSPATAEAAALLQDAVPKGTPVVSLQNGVGNPAVARANAPALRIVPGMVPFNVAQLGPGHFHRGTEGHVAVQADPAIEPWRATFARAGLPLDVFADLAPVQWGKLLLNLNNPVNALSGLPLQAQLLDRGHRHTLAALIEEALGLLARARIEPARMSPLPWRWMPTFLRLPTPVFRVAAARMLRMDAKARSSMADDVAQGRRTEVDALCGEFVRLAARLGTTAPRNAEMVRRIEALGHPGV
ncbi:MAG: 2-dehydropantoate 2-reductase [Rhizobacter sp.]